MSRPNLAVSTHASLVHVDLHSSVAVPPGSPMPHHYDQATQPRSHGARQEPPTTTTTTLAVTAADGVGVAARATNCTCAAPPFPATQQVQVLLSPLRSLAHRDSFSSPAPVAKKYKIYYCLEMAGLAQQIVKLDERFVLTDIQWDHFPDGFPNLFINEAEDVKFFHVCFLANFHSPAVFFEQFSVITAIPKLLPKSFKLFLPFFPTGTMERVSRLGEVATANSLARVLSTIPTCSKGPAQICIFDIHALQNQFYFKDTVLIRLGTCVNLLLDRIATLPDRDNVNIAFPDDGAAKRFGDMFPTYKNIIICHKVVRDGDKRVVKQKEGDVIGKHCIIVDDLVQSGGTMHECAKELLRNGASCVSAYVTHAIFPNQSYEKFFAASDAAAKPNSCSGSFKHFFVTDSNPKIADLLRDRAPFEVLSISKNIARVILDEDDSERRRVQAQQPSSTGGGLSMGGMGDDGGWAGGQSSSRAAGGVYLASLNTYQVGWTVTARVFTKSEVRSYSNERGAGKIASLVFVDASGSMKCVMFGESADKWMPVLQEGQLYRISGARITNSRDSQYSGGATSEYDMIVTNDTQFQELEDDASFPYHSLRPAPLSDLQQLLERQKDAAAQGGMLNMGPMGGAQGQPVDIIGIITEYSPMTTITSKRQQQLTKRDLTVMDQSGASVKITIWGDKFQLDEQQLQPPHIAPNAISCNVLAVSSARISDYSGCSLSTSFASGVFVNPQWAETKQLRDWFAAKGAKLIQGGNVQMLSVGQGDGLSKTEALPWSNIAFMHKLRNEHSDQQPMAQPIFLKVQARLTFIKKDQEKPPWYVACPLESCKGKKVQPSDGDQFFCERCNEVTVAPNYRYLLSIVLQDETGSIWLSCFDREGEKILGVSAREMNKLREEDPARYNQVFAQATNKDWVFGVKVETRVDPLGSGQFDNGPRFQACSVTPLNYSKDAAELAEFIVKLDSAVMPSDTDMQI